MRLISPWIKGILCGSSHESFLRVRSPQWITWIYHTTPHKSLQGGAPPSYKWVIIPLTIDITRINHSYCLVLKPHQANHVLGKLQARSQGPVGPDCILCQKDGIAWLEHVLGLGGSWCFPLWVKQCHVYHPPVIAIYIGGMFTIPSHGWFMALFNHVLTTLEGK